MKASGIFWGSLLIFLGLFFLLDNIDVMEFKIDNMLQYWPIVLIIWGIALLKVPQIVKSILAGLSGILAALLIIGLVTINWKFDMFDDDDDDKDEIEFYGNDEEYEEGEEPSVLTVPFDSAYRSANFNFKGGAGKFEFGGTTSDLVKIKASGTSRDINYTVSDDGKSVDVSCKFDTKSKFFKGIQKEREAEINLNPDLYWNLFMKVGASDIDCDLSEYMVRNVELKAGAADMELKVGNRTDTTNLEVEAGAANFEISVPKSSGCAIFSKTGLSNRDFYGFTSYGEGKYFFRFQKGDTVKTFTSYGEGKYKTPEFNESKKKVFIKISGGVSNFEVERY